jgi:hypothetical protein
MMCRFSLTANVPIQQVKQPNARIEPSSIRPTEAVQAPPEQT